MPSYLCALLRGDFRPSKKTALSRMCTAVSERCAHDMKYCTRPVPVLFMTHPKRLSHDLQLHRRVSTSIEAVFQGLRRRLEGIRGTDRVTHRYSQEKRGPVQATISSAVLMWGSASRENGIDSSVPHQWQVENALPTFHIALASCKSDHPDLIPWDIAR